LIRGRHLGRKRRSPCSVDGGTAGCVASSARGPLRRPVDDRRLARDGSLAAEANATVAVPTFSSTPGVDMRVEIRNAEDPDTVSISVAGAGLGIPAVLLVTPDHVGHPFASVPAGHRFEGYRGDFGAPRELLAVARDVLAKRIDRPTAEAEFVRILARWDGEDSR
jgi:hypothetical protein